MKKQPEVTEATRKSIIKAFWTLFQTTPIEKITIAELSAAAGIHRSSFYRYFPDVYKVFEEFQTELFDEVSQKLCSITESEDISLVQYTEKTADILLAHADELYRLLNYSDCNFKSSILKILKKLIIKVLHINMQDPDAEYLTTFITSCMLTNFNYWYEHKSLYSLMDINRKGQAILLNGLLSYISQNQS